MVRVSAARAEDTCPYFVRNVAVIGQIQSVGLIELCAIGIGHDVSAYYPVSRQIDQVGKLADAVIGILDQLLVTGKARS